jgi:hypothetical protein
MMGSFGTGMSQAYWSREESGDERWNGPEIWTAKREPRLVILTLRGPKSALKKELPDR